MKELTVERLREVLAYDQETGLFTRRVRTANCVKVGDVAGSLHRKGYIRINVDGRRYFAHRLAWLYVNGEWPPAEIDHINGVKDDNRIVNLRLATRIENMQNERVSRSNNKAGYLGVFLHSCGKFSAKICIDGKNKHLGMFPTPESAHEAYLEAKRQLHHFCTL